MDWPRGWSVFLVTCVSAINHGAYCAYDEFIGVDQKQLECVEPPIPELCDHSPERCQSCWKGYPQSRFPNWTKKQVEKAKISNIIDKYSKIKPCVCYRVDVNDHGFFTNTKEITAAYGDEDVLWDNLIHEQVSCRHVICGALPKKIIFLETIRYTIEGLVHPRFVRTGSSDAGHKVSIIYPSFFEYSYKHKLRYNIEPFFWSSSLNWIPSRFQEEIQDNVGDREFCSEVLVHWILFWRACRYHNHLDVLTLHVRSWCSPTRS